MFPVRSARLAASPGFLALPGPGVAVTASAPRSPGQWSQWSGPGFLICSRKRPVRFSSAVVPGGAVFWVPGPLPSQWRAKAGRPPSPLKGSAGFRARSFKFSAGLAGGSRRWLWVVWEGPAASGAPRRATVLAWLAGQFPHWAFT